MVAAFCGCAATMPAGARIERQQPDNTGPMTLFETDSQVLSVAGWHAGRVTSDGACPGGVFKTAVRSCACGPPSDVENAETLNIDDR